MKSYSDSIRPGAVRTRGALTVVLAAASITLSGCFTTPTPDLRIVGAQLVERTEAGVVINVEIEGANRTANDMKLRSIHYWMSLDDQLVFEGDRTPQATFPALGVQSFTVPIAAPTNVLPTGDSARYRFGATLKYLVPGPLAEAMYDLNVHKPTVQISASEQIDLHVEPSAAPSSTPN